MAKKINQINEFPVYVLDRTMAEKYKKEITAIWNLIPLSVHAVDDILKEEGENSQYYGKWEHSMIVLDPQEKSVIAFIVGYEREAEENSEYPKDSLHLKSLSVHSEYQNHGIGRKLVQIWLDFNTKQGFQYLNGNFCFSTQTNSASWNDHVQKFYESFGFQKVATKKYSNKVDFVYFADEL